METRWTYGMCIPNPSLTRCGTARVCKFLQMLMQPTSVEKDGTVTNMFPHEARLRNLTYSAPLYVDVQLNQYQVSRDLNVNDPAEDMGEPIATEHAKKEFLGYVPIMLRSLFCVLSDKDDADLSGTDSLVFMSLAEGANLSL